MSKRMFLFIATRETPGPRTLMMFFWLLTFAILVNVANAETNLLVNGNFETTTYSDWYCMGPCSLAPSDDARQGQHSVQVTGRTAIWNGLAQAVSFSSGERYKITAYVKLLNTANNAAYQTVGLMEKCTVAGNSVYTRIGQTPLIQPGDWYQIGGVRRIADGSSNCKIYVQTDAPADYLVDDASVTHIPTSAWAEWSEAAEDRIDQIRKADINIQ
ncbi:endo-1,4-beta-xylanase A-like [Mercenaria mercenaria]|uniref:endo-1,4-beta-xylanase A-like n=1 Tax=Mercenaria mercenaria TaxID=6596 RepID=UPI00234EA118|nr:endo-1,4-beta-xylanase A-like [Mercenaria mercenaria]